MSIVPAIAQPILAMTSGAILSLVIPILALLVVLLLTAQVHRRTVQVMSIRVFAPQKRIKRSNVGLFLLALVPMGAAAFFYARPHVGSRQDHIQTRFSQRFLSHPDRIGARDRFTGRREQFAVLHERAPDIEAEFGRLAVQAARKIDHAVTEAVDDVVDSQALDWTEEFEGELDAGCDEATQASSSTRIGGSEAAGVARPRISRSRPNPWTRLGMLALIGFATAAFLYAGYVFLDAGTRGQFTWQLRAVSAVAFLGILIAVLSVRQTL